MIGFPCDVPIFMYFYRKDIYDELGLDAGDDDGGVPGTTPRRSTRRRAPRASTARSAR